jgi:uncharacterized protein
MTLPTFRKSALLALFFVAAATLVRAQQPEVPTLTSYVTDQAGVLDESQRSELERDLRAYEDSTSNQFVVLVVPSVGEQAIEEYAHAVALKNGIGQKGKDNGLLLVVAVNDHKWRVHVGNGLQPKISDGDAGSIMRSEAVPRFRGNDYYGGIRAAIAALMLDAAGEFTADEHKGADGPRRIGLGGVVIMIFVFIIIMKSFRRGGRGGGGGGLGGLLPWLILSQGSRGFGRGGGWGGGGGGGFGGGGGGGFSGGGGGFDGGGASGSW